MAEREPGAGVRPAAQVPASEVKRAWHSFIDRVSQAREEIVVTRYGKPVMRLVPVDEGSEEPGIVGFLAGTVMVHGDIVGPGHRWNADL